MRRHADGVVMTILGRLRQAVVEQRYRISSHANEEMSEDRLTAEDIEQLILRGRIARRYTRDLRGTRYEIAGCATDGRRARVVCRFLSSASW